MQLRGKQMVNGVEVSQGVGVIDSSMVRPFAGEGLPNSTTTPAPLPVAPALTIGMATYDDFDGVYFTLQALRLYQDLADVELLVVDNYGCSATERFCKDWACAKYVKFTEVQGTAAPREMVFRGATGKAVLCLDSHVLLEPDAVFWLKMYYQDHPATMDLLSGPLMYDDLRTLATHMEPVWRDHMFGTWASDQRGRDPDGEPFEVPMQGLGLFSCRKEAWPGFNPAFRGFGGEEGYIHEKFRRQGGKCLCLPWLTWAHRFQRPQGVPYRNDLGDRLSNYLIGWQELGLDDGPVLDAFADLSVASVLAAKMTAFRVSRGTLLRPALVEKEGG
jgi:hypothetical protein